VSFASWTHEPALQTSEWEVSSPRPHERVEVEFFLVDARPVIDHASGAVGFDPPAMDKGVSEGQICQDNIFGPVYMYASQGDSDGSKDLG
jgi:hypothetical protein